MADFPIPVQRSILEHHEREDGSGYPQNLTANNISDYAKIISVVCSYEAMSSPRNFREARTTYDAMVEMLKNKYDGYHFSENSPDIFNPFSLFNSLQKQKLDNYWFSSGTPTYLTEQISKYNIDPQIFDNGFYATEDMFNVPTENANTIYPVLYQSGYITIKKYIKNEFMPYILAYPNEEVRQGFVKCLIAHYSKLNSQEYNIFINNLIQKLKLAQLEDLLLDTIKIFE